MTKLSISSTNIIQNRNQYPSYTPHHLHPKLSLFLHINTLYLASCSLCLDTCIFILNILLLTS
ncbi:hypothetical protein LX69_03031 [Breznakibacter xylanolyticus]|uniref:Uncharacterized protein n=1 Tax=Breznakibacter xylanolyticus TaxID=990 RepID=A0A2W7MUT2_9BACT|nr:hypothetical protein LX69_03031 [Breznakibacter xylanolyticus]